MVCMNLFKRKTAVCWNADQIYSRDSTRNATVPLSLSLSLSLLFLIDPIHSIWIQEGRKKQSILCLYCKIDFFNHECWKKKIGCICWFHFQQVCGIINKFACGTRGKDPTLPKCAEFSIDHELCEVQSEVAGWEGEGRVLFLQLSFPVRRCLIGHKR